MHRLFGEILTAALPHHVRLDVQRVALDPGLEVADWRPTGQVVLAVEHGAVLVTAARATQGDASLPDVLTDDGVIAIEPRSHVGVRGAGDDVAAIMLLSLQEAPTAANSDSHVPCAPFHDTRRSGSG